MIMQNETKFRLSLTSWLVVAAVVLIGLPISPSAIVASTAEFSSDPAAPVEAPLHRHVDDDDEGDELVTEIIEEIVEGLTEMNEEITEAIEEAREEIEEGISEAPDEVMVALSEVNVKSIVYDALKDAPKVVHLFVKEVDPAGLIEKIVDNANVDSDEVDEDILNKVRSKITDEISGHIAKLSQRSNDQVASARRQITEGIAELPVAVRQQIVEANLPGVVEEVTRNSHAVVRQFVADVNVRDTLKRALRSASGTEGSRTRVRQRERESGKRIREKMRRAGDTHRSEDSREQARVELEKRLVELMKQVEVIRHEMRELERDR